MQRNLASLLLQYARLDRKRSHDGLNASEAELLAKLNRYLSNALMPNVPPGAERRTSIRVPAELPCRWAPVARREDGRITTLSRTGAFIRTSTPAPVGQEISIEIQLPAGGTLEVPGSVANQRLGADPERCGMGVRFGRMAREAMDRIDGLYEHSILREYGTPDGSGKPDDDATSE
ncbi:MAG: PilZ domain-containing protein [Polyangiaceae bacterium]|nr:PilZ domain-containing protein [Polyangiaceae bacterium]